MNVNPRPRISSSGRPRLLLGLLIVATSLHGAWGDGIAISATSSPGYIRPTDAHGQPQPETYIFMEGEFMGGNTKDKSQVKMQFSEITKMLAVNLEKQSYYPTSDIPAANLLIRIFWGTTTVYDDPQKEQAVENMNAALGNYSAAAEANGGDADPGELNAAIDRVNTGVDSAMSAIERNAALLGYQRTLTKEQGNRVNPTTKEMTMSMELNEERYFVVLMAYDYQFMRKEKKPKLLWVTRLSMRSPGHNFVEALPALAVAGSDVFGKSLDGLQRVRINERQVEVKMGELKMLGTVENAPEPKKEK